MPFAGGARPDDCLLALFDVLFGGASWVVDAEDQIRLHRQVGYGDAAPGEQLIGMPFNLGDDTVGFVP